MKLQQPRFLIFFVVMLILPAGLSYLAGFETTFDSFFYIRAFAIAFCLTVFYYLIVKGQKEKAE